MTNRPAQARPNLPSYPDHAAPGAGGLSQVPLTLSGVQHAFGRGFSQVVALRGIDVSFAAGTWTAVMGPSGSGKSTLLHCAAGLLRPTAGEVNLAGVDIRKASGKQITRLHRDQVGFVFQSFNLVPALTAAQNVALPTRWAGKRLSQGQIRAALARVGLENRANHRPDQLSGGQQQRVAIARALVTQRAVIFADEPTGALDRASGAGVMEVFRSATDQGSAVVMVTHDPAVAACADRVLFLVDGTLGAQLPGGDPELIASALANAESTATGRSR